MSPVSFEIKEFCFSYDYLYMHEPLILFMLRYNIDRDVDEGVFILKFGPVICLSPPADCLLDGYLLTDVKIPIPLCRDFVFPGNSMFSPLSCEDIFVCIK